MQQSPACSKPADSDPNYTVDCEEPAISAVLTKRRDHMSDPDLLRALGAIGTLKQTWQSLGSENLTRVKMLLGNASVESLIDERAFASGVPAEPTLKGAYENAIGKLSLDQVEIMTRKPYPKDQWVPRVLENVRAVRGYRNGERAIRLVLGVTNSMTLSDVGVVADEFVKNDQIHHASDVPQLLELLIKQTIAIVGVREVWREAFDTYDAARNPDLADGQDWYSYSDARQALSA